MKKLILIATILLAGCGDPNYVEPVEQHKNLDGRPIPVDTIQPNY